MQGNIPQSIDIFKLVGEKTEVYLPVNKQRKSDVVSDFRCLGLDYTVEKLMSVEHFKHILHSEVCAVRQIFVTEIVVDDDLFFGLDRIECGELS